ncbi:LysR family transcriptional regulator [Rhizobium calliandrae]|uniref:LysR family transcriptional regulator n=1 Tax=Rhizobium calliandrae TaxID=1312182 RepID=A0ABT7KA13_9HYPH|nr:LysR family transcriptional regulator [Rhizobium calliandrae]MDL2404243.1 LysR family transcriptional regulator [Rhizobium calliandrae]
MDRDLLAHLPVFLAVARLGSFAGAAGELSLSPSAVSHAIRTVESRLGATLFARTTRSVALTEAGNDLLGIIGPGFSQIEDGLDQFRANTGNVTGLLRLNVPRTALALAITPVVVELSQRFPQLTVEIAIDDASIDIIAGGFDAGVRLGEMIAQDMVATRLTAPFKMILAAAPDYLTRMGEPRAIPELASHNCIGFRQITAGSLYDWELNDGGTMVSVAVRGSSIVTDATYAKELALAGVGITYLMEPLARAEIESGKLKQLLPETAIEEPGLFLYYPKRAASAPKLRAFIDVAKYRLKSQLA